MDTSQLNIGILVLDVNFHCTPPLEAQARGCRRSLVQGLPGGHFYDRQIIKKYFPTITRKLYFFTNYWTYSLIVRPIATPTPVGLDVALPTEGGRARSLRSHVATIPYSALASPIPALPWRLRSFPQNVWNSFHAVRRGTNFFRFVYTTHKYHWVNDLSFPTNSQ